MRILISGRRPITRSALELYLQHKPNLDVVAEAADAQTLLAQAKANKPDAVLLDWDLCDRPLEEFVSTLRQIENRPGVILTNAVPGSKQVALDAGAGAFVARGHDSRDLLLAIETIRIQREEQRASRPTTSER